jgi:hypothetical protein
VVAVEEQDLRPDGEIVRDERGFQPRLWPPAGSASSINAAPVTNTTVQSNAVEASASLANEEGDRR